MFEVYAAGVEYQLICEQRERALRHLALRAARADRESERRVGHIRPAIRVWPRPIALHVGAMTRGRVAPA